MSRDQLHAFGTVILVVAIVASAVVGAINYSRTTDALHRVAELTRSNSGKIAHVDQKANGTIRYLREKTTYLPGVPSLPGGPGPRGLSGAAGAGGRTGAQGFVGFTGPAGQLGKPGPIGATGLTGMLGLTGPMGQLGPKGDTGAKGDKGDTGAPGANGADGAVGPTGPGPTGAELQAAIAAYFAGHALSCMPDPPPAVTITCT